MYVLMVTCRLRYIGLVLGVFSLLFVVRRVFPIMCVLGCFFCVVVCCCVLLSVVVRCWSRVARCVLVVVGCLFCVVCLYAVCCLFVCDLRLACYVLFSVCCLSFVVC